MDEFFLVFEGDRVWSEGPELFGSEGEGAVDDAIGVGDGEERVLLPQFLVDPRVDLPDIVPVRILLALINLFHSHSRTLPLTRRPEVRTTGPDWRGTRGRVFVGGFHFISFIGVIISYGGDTKPYRRGHRPMGRGPSVRLTAAPKDLLMYPIPNPEELARMMR